MTADIASGGAVMVRRMLLNRIGKTAIRNGEGTINNTLVQKPLNRREQARWGMTQNDAGIRGLVLDAGEVEWLWSAERTLRLGRMRDSSDSDDGGVTANPQIAVTR